MTEDSKLNKRLPRLAPFTAVYEKAEEDHIGYCLEIPGANGQGGTTGECHESLREAVKLILQDRLDDALEEIPEDAIQEGMIVE